MTAFLFGLLDHIPGLGYPAKSALVRAIKAALSVFIGILLTAATAGALFPATWSPVVVIAITAILQAVDKYFREAAAENDPPAGDTPPTP